MTQQGEEAPGLLVDFSLKLCFIVCILFYKKIKIDQTRKYFKIHKTEKCKTTFCFHWRILVNLADELGLGVKGASGAVLPRDPAVYAVISIWVHTQNYTATVFHDELF